MKKIDVGEFYYIKNSKSVVKILHLEPKIDWCVVEYLDRCNGVNLRGRIGGAFIEDINEKIEKIIITWL